MNHYEKSEIDSVLSRTLSLRSAALSQSGKEHPENKDAVFEHTTQAKNGECIGLYIICDGFGDDEMDHPASQLAIQTIVAELGRVFAVIDSQADPTLTQPSLFTLYEWLRTAVGQANEKVWLCNQSQHLTGEACLGTTLTLALVHGDVVRIANVGDSRTYVWRRGELMQITRDHCVVAELAEAGFLSEAEAANHPHNKTVCRALGPQPGVEVDMFEWQLQAGDKLMLCSDGLWRSFPDSTELSTWLSTNTLPEELCWQLIAEASYRDDFDDISVIIVQAEDQHDYYLEQAAQAYEPLPTEMAVPVPSTLVS